MRIVSLILVPLLISSPLAASAAEPTAYLRSNGQFVSRGTEYKRTFWVPAVRDADEAFQSNYEALEEYHKHVEAARWFTILNWGALGAFVTYTAIASANDSFNGLAGALIFFIPWTGGAIMLAKSNQHLLRAINLVNGVPAPQAHQRERGFTLKVPLLAYSF